jgi:hypothetical protein
MYDSFQVVPPTKDAIGESLIPKREDLREAKIPPMITHFPLMPVVMYFVFL